MSIRILILDLNNDMIYLKQMNILGMLLKNARSSLKSHDTD